VSNKTRAIASTSSQVLIRFGWMEAAAVIALANMCKQTASSASSAQFVIR
jgi:hypothetical protein